MWFWAEAVMWSEKGVLYYETQIRGISTKAKRQKQKIKRKKQKRKQESKKK